MNKQHTQGTIVDFGHAEYRGTNTFYLVLQNDKGQELPVIRGKGLEDAFQRVGNLQKGEKINLKDMDIDEVSKKRLWEIERHEPYKELENAIERDVERDLQKLQNIDKTKEIEPTVNETKKSKLIEFGEDLPDSIKNNYVGISKNQFMKDEKVNYYDKTDPDKVNIAFEDRKNSLNTSRQDDKTVKAMMDLAESKGWTAVKLKGTEEFKQKAWIEASLRGIETKGYEPTEKDKAELIAKQEARTINHVEATAIKEPVVISEKAEEHLPSPALDTEAKNQPQQNLVSNIKLIWSEQSNEENLTFESAKDFQTWLVENYPSNEIRTDGTYSKNKISYEVNGIPVETRLYVSMNEEDLNPLTQTWVEHLEKDNKFSGYGLSEQQIANLVNEAKTVMPLSSESQAVYDEQVAKGTLSTEDLTILRESLADIDQNPYDFAKDLASHKENLDHTQSLMDEMQRQEQQLSEKYKPLQEKEIKAQIREITQNGYRNGTITNRTDLVNTLNDHGYEVVKENEKSIRLKIPYSDHHLTLKGEMFTKDFDALKQLKASLEPDAIKERHPQISDTSIAQITAWKNHVLEKYETPQAQQEILNRLEMSVADVANGKDLGMPNIPDNEIQPDIQIQIATTDKSRSR